RTRSRRMEQARLREPSPAAREVAERRAEECLLDPSRLGESPLRLLWSDRPPDPSERRTDWRRRYPRVSTVEHDVMMESEFGSQLGTRPSRNIHRPVGVTATGPRTARAAPAPM